MKNIVKLANEIIDDCKFSTKGITPSVIYDSYVCNLIDENDPDREKRKYYKFLEGVLLRKLGNSIIMYSEDDLSDEQSEHWQNEEEFDVLYHNIKTTKNFELEIGKLADGRIIIRNAVNMPFSCVDYFLKA